jgi:hypothetical protein
MWPCGARNQARPHQGGPLKPSCRLLELLETNRQPVTIGKILIPPRPVDHLPDDPLEPEFEKRAIVDFEQPVRDVNAEIGVDPDQIGIEGRMMDFR